MTPSTTLYSLLATAIAMSAVVLVLGPQGAAGDISAVRMRSNPQVDPRSLAYSCDGDYSINFPTVIKAPRWLKPRLGDYYMYFSDHHGLFIYLAYADNINGPWMTYAPPTLTLAQVYAANNATFNLLNRSSSTECASPDVYVDNARRQIVMYFHARLPYNSYKSMTGIAFSFNGIDFAPLPGFFALPYTRRFTWRGDRYTYLLDRVGNIMRSLDGYTNLTLGGGAIGAAFTNASMVNGDGYTGLLRHLGVSVVGNILYVFGTRIGDAPERILWTSVDLSCTRTNWSACAPAHPALEAFRPQYEYEGADLPNVPSSKGNAPGPVNQLRDPFPFAADDKCYIFYAAAGESAIAAARISDRFCFDDDDDGHGHASSAA